ncbi:hypothetical protein BpHYR1_029961 [Brachionus plicatilis]|uniref:Uncharacterized protein n=1 Tax=Brachionus plicatilis TaxID=10195 RepID=A0A3M7P3T8_BRAPC|nr:hypothetical protein BpHYR1_029961 [Brachionus plicatilis]
MTSSQTQQTGLICSIECKFYSWSDLKFIQVLQLSQTRLAQKSEKNQAKRLMLKHGLFFSKI